ncbi:MAG: hypothetical protein WCD30_14920, partial [Pseudolabrys sp.]
LLTPPQEWQAWRQSRKYNPAHCFLHPVEIRPLRSLAQPNAVKAYGFTNNTQESRRLDGRTVHRLFIAAQPTSYQAWESD